MSSRTGSRHNPENRSGKSGTATAYPGGDLSPIHGFGFEWVRKDYFFQVLSPGALAVYDGLWFGNERLVFMSGLRFVFPVLLVVMIVGVGLLVPTVTMVRERANKTQCVNNLKVLGKLSMMVEDAHKGARPIAIRDQGESVLEKLSQLPSFEPGLLHCAADPEAGISYEFVDQAVPRKAGKQQEWLRCRVDHGEGTHVLFADFRVSLVRHSE